MAYGPGKYDKECGAVMGATGALTVVVIVVGGARGSGFSVQSVAPNVEHYLPDLLRQVANQVEVS